MTALLFALLSFMAGSLEPGPAFPKPNIHRVRVAGDTVWFEGDRGYDAVRIRYCFARRTGAWCRLPQFDTAIRTAPRVPRTTGDTVPLTSGLSLVCRAQSGQRTGCGAFGVLTADDHRVHWLAPQLTPAGLATLRRAYDIETEEPLSVSDWVTDWAVAEDAIWFGVAGGFPEGEGAFGGLLRFDRLRRTIQTIVQPDLAAATVTSLAVDGGALWVGTLHPVEYGAVGSTGIIRQDLRTGAWTTLDAAGEHLPDKLIQTLTSRDGTVFAATADGLVAFDARTATWTARYFRRTIVGDSIVYSLEKTRPADEASDEALFVVMHRLAVTRRAAFAAAARSVGLHHLRPVLGDRAPLDSVVARRPFIPFLIEALSTQGGSAVAAAALVRIGDSSAVPALRTALGRPAPPYETAPIAVALARFGDPAGLSLLHERLGSRGDAYDRQGILPALAALKDPRSVPLILAFATRANTHPDARHAAVGALRAYGSTAVWRQLVDTGAVRPELRGALIDLADSVALSDARVSAALGSWALELLDSDEGGENLRAAVRLGARLRPHDAVPVLVRFLSDSSQGGAAAVELVRLTGVESAPPLMPWTEPGRALAQHFWEAWLAAHGARYEVVRPDVGERAYQAWFRRVLERERLDRRRLERQRLERDRVPSTQRRG